MDPLASSSFVEQTERQKLQYPDGSAYDGYLLDGLHHGFGILKDCAGNVYEGNWKQGLKDGFFIVRNLVCSNRISNLQ